MAEYIEREAACALMPDDYYGWRDKQLLKSVPAADVVPVRHGHDTSTSRYFHCSECDYGVSDVFEDGPTLCFEKQKSWNYCPCCGARMDGET